MDKEINHSYLSDDQLEDLMAGVEENDMYQAPDYLQQMILRRAEPGFVRESVEIVPIRHAIREGRPLLAGQESQKKQFRSYTIKIVAAAAAALALVFTMPNPEFISFQPKVEMGERERNAGVKKINEKTSDFCSAILEKTNQLFQKEEKIND